MSRSARMGAARMGAGLLLGSLALCFQAKAHEVTYEAKVCECVGDVDGNGTVDALDIQEILDCFGGSCLDSNGSEYDCPQAGGCAEDVNHNHQIGEGDIEMLLANWGSCRTEGDVNRDGDLDWDDVAMVLDDFDRNCRADLDGNGRVNGNDVAIAEAAWGATEDPHLGTDVNDDGVLTIIDLLLVIETMGLDCRSDVDRSGIVGCRDVNWVCDRTGSDCSELECFGLPNGGWY